MSRGGVTMSRGLGTHPIQIPPPPKKIKEQSEEIKKNKRKTSKKIFAFAWCGQALRYDNHKAISHFA